MARSKIKNVITPGTERLEKEFSSEISKDETFIMNDDLKPDKSKKKRQIIHKIPK